MESGFRKTWKRGRQAAVHHDGYTIAGVRYHDSKDERAFGWHVWSCGSAGRSHYFWVFERAFFAVQIEPEEFRAGLDPVDLGNRIFPDLVLVPTGEYSKTEMDAVLAAIEDWEGAGEVAPAV